MSSFEQAIWAMKPDPDHAQILLEIDSDLDELSTVLEILNSENYGPVTYRILVKTRPVIVLIYLPSPDMRMAVLRLSEAGFIKISGMNAIKHSETY